ncbi:MAG TPA: hypothetical protein VJO35_14675 [Terriglobales bacterium]|nr:hypothetical protein [Terriglobales bacterium]
MKESMCHFCAIVISIGLTLGSAYAGSADSTPPAALGPSSTMSSAGDAGMFGFGVKASLLGVGAEVATRVTHRTNARVGFNVLGYSRDFSKDGINYNGHLSFRSVEAHYDIFPWARSFHVGPGVLAYIGNPITANALVPGNQSFTLGGHTYYSDPSAPMTASGKVNFNQVAPMITVGWGNLVRRDSKHFSIPVELGVAFQGSPKSTLSLAGNVCTPGPAGSLGTTCTSTSSSTVQSNVLSEQTKINKSMSPFKAYPIISVGFGYKF